MNMRWILFAVGALALAAAFVFTQVRILPDSRRTAPPYAIEVLKNRDDLNVVFVMIDTLRADRLGAWGYERDTSPHLDDLAARGIRFAQHRTQSTWTKTSMASLWTGLHPERSGVLGFSHRLSDAAVMPAEILADEGFRTVGIWRNGWVAPTFGFSQGFSIYHRPQPQRPDAAFRRKQAEDPRVRLQGSDLDLTKAAQEFLRVHGKDRFFLYLHYMDVHQYMSDETSARFGTTYSDYYDSSIHWTDRLLKMLMDGLDEAGVLDRTIVVIASDHGEAFGEHGNEGHAKDLYDEVLRVPWIILLPFVLDEGLVVETPTSNVDIWPTIFEMIGVEGVEGLDGRSRMPEIRGAAGIGAPGGPDESPPTIAHLNRNWGKTEAPYFPVIAVADEFFKYIHWPTTPEADEFYDLKRDPRERQNLVSDAESQDLVESYRADVVDYLDSPDAPWGAGVEEVELDDMQKGILRALGYVIE
jgi:arylsulfatase A-like enzyme